MVLECKDCGEEFLIKIEGRFSSDAYTRHPDGGTEAEAISYLRCPFCQGHVKKASDKATDRFLGFA